MEKTLIGIYDSWSAVDGAVNDLKGAGFRGDSIHVMSGSQFLDEIGAKEEGGFMQKLKHKLGFGETEYSASNIRADDTVLLVDTADDDSANLAAEILNMRGATDIDTRYAAPERTAEPTPESATGKKTIPVTEEELRVGKRAVKHGGVRVYTHAVEHPVEEEISLRKERVHVERRPTDRPASEAEMAGMKEESVEVTATSEEPVVSKKGRVKEEVVIGKEAGEERERIHETLRGTEVEVEQLSPEEESEFSTYEDEIRAQASSPAMQGIGYDDVRRSYRYGFHKGHQYHDGDWRDVEPKLRSDWEAHKYGPWDKYKAAVRSGWERGAHPRA